MAAPIAGPTIGAEERNHVAGLFHSHHHLAIHNGNNGNNSNNSNRAGRRGGTTMGDDHDTSSISLEALTEGMRMSSIDGQKFDADRLANIFKSKLSTAGMHSADIASVARKLEEISMDGRNNQQQYHGSYHHQHHQSFHGGSGGSGYYQNLGDDASVGSASSMPSFRSNFTAGGIGGGNNSNPPSHLSTVENLLTSNTSSVAGGGGGGANFLPRPKESRGIFRAGSPFRGRGRSPARNSNRASAPQQQQHKVEDSNTSSQQQQRSFLGVGNFAPPPAASAGLRNERRTARSRSPFNIFSGRNRQRQQPQQQQQQQQHADQSVDEKKEDATNNNSNSHRPAFAVGAPSGAAPSLPRPCPPSPSRGTGSFLRPCPPSPSRGTGRQSPRIDPSADPLPAQPPRAASPMPPSFQSATGPPASPGRNATAGGIGGGGTDSRPCSPSVRPGLQEDDDDDRDYSKLSSMSPSRPQVSIPVRRSSRHTRSHSSIAAFSPRQPEADDDDDGSVQPQMKARGSSHNQEQPGGSRPGHRKSISDTKIDMPSLQEIDDANDLVGRMGGIDLGLPDLRRVHLRREASDGFASRKPPQRTSANAGSSTDFAESIFTPPAAENHQHKHHHDASDEDDDEAASGSTISMASSDEEKDAARNLKYVGTGKGKMRRKGGGTPTFATAAEINLKAQPAPFPYAASAQPQQQQQQQQHDQPPVPFPAFPHSGATSNGSYSGATSNISFTSSFPPPPPPAETVKFVVDLKQPKQRHPRVNARRGSATLPVNTHQPHRRPPILQQQQQQQPPVPLPQQQQQQTQPPSIPSIPPQPQVASVAGQLPARRHQPQVQFQSPPPRSMQPSPMEVDTPLDQDVQFNIGSTNMVQSRRSAFRDRRGPTATDLLASPPPAYANRATDGDTSNLAATPPLFHAVAASSVGVDTPDANQANSAEEAERQAAIEAEEARRTEAVAALRNEARGLFVAADYRASIHSYTKAIQLFYGVDEPNDTLAVLYSNRAACFNMIRAYDAALEDCKKAMSHISDGGDSSDTVLSTDGGPVLKIKVLTRQARALLRQGEYEAALGAFESARNEATSTSALLKVLNPHSPSDSQNVLAQMETEAALGKIEAERLRDTVQKIERCTVGSAGLERRDLSEALGHVNMALRSANGSAKLFQAKLQILANMKRWREVAGYCERLAASNVEMDGVFVGELESKSPFPGNQPARFLTSSTFGDDDDVAESEIKLSSRAAGEAVVRLPHSLAPFYLRALRLEERYPAAESALRALEELIELGTSAMDSASLRTRFSWLGKERSKLLRTKTDRERGDEFFRLNDFDIAAAQYASCLQIDAEGLDMNDGENAGGRLHAVLHCNRAACLMAVRRFHDAIDECSRALRIHPRYMKAMLRRCRCYVRLHRYQEAISEYKRWLELVDEGRKPPKHHSSASFVTPCLFDGPQNVADSDYQQVKRELQECLISKRRVDSAAREEESRRRERQNWHEAFHSAAFNDNSSTSSAQQRRERWHNQNGENDSRRWDSFSGRRPRGATGGGTSSNRHQRSKSWGQKSSSTSEPNVGSPGSDLSVDHYAVLGVSRNASDDDIKKRYRRLALQHHPDKDKSEGAADRFRRIKLAYETLSDSALRRQYDFELRRS